MTYHKSDEFRALQQEWYGKLKQSGFRDIEQWTLQENGDLEPAFLVDHIGRGRAISEQGAETQGADLFVVLGRHFHTVNFEDFTRRTWALLYVNGWRGAEIARLFPRLSAKTVTTYLARFRAAALAVGLHRDDDNEEVTT
jgi:hypothetical protein